MSRTDIAGIVISVVAALVSLIALCYTICSDCKNKETIKEEKKYKVEKDAQIKDIEDRLNSIVKEGLHEISESILNLNKNQQNIILRTVIINNYQEPTFEEEHTIFEQKSVYNKKINQKINKAKKEQRESKRRKAVRQATKK